MTSPVPRPPRTEPLTPTELLFLARVGTEVVRYLDGGGRPTIEAFGAHLTGSEQGTA